MMAIHPILMLALALPPTPAAEDHFTIKVVDRESGRGIPLVELKTVNAIRFYTDSNGIVAFHEPGLMNRQVYFSVKSHGYEFAKDGFGFRGVRLLPKAGETAVVKMKRLNVAERLYRVTGAGIYRDSLLVGHSVPTEEPVLNAQVFGSDSVVNTIYRGKIYWFWGDTNRPSYPLGNFHVPGATSLLPEDGGLDPEKGVNLKYFVDKNGFAKPTAKMPGPGPTWIGGLVNLKDPETKKERLFAHYVRVKPKFEIYQRGLLEWNDAKKQFEKVVQFDMHEPMYPNGHPLKHVDGGVEYVYFATPFPLVRVRATPKDLSDLSKLESYSPFLPGSDDESLKLDRDANGKLRFAWRNNTPRYTQNREAKLIKSGKIKPEEAILQLRHADTGKKVLAHGGSVYWNEYRKRWVMIVLETFGSSMLGEIWYAEADRLTGPWRYARKVVTHDKYSFYNPKQHPFFDKNGGRIIFFEGTFTHTFSGNPDQTPRYDYNQIMYKLDLADDRLVLPAPVYRSAGPSAKYPFAMRPQLKDERENSDIAFFALDRPKPGAVAIVAEKTANGMALMVGSKNKGSTPPCLFYALPTATKNPPKTAIPLYEWIHSDGMQRKYSIEASADYPDYQRSKEPVCLVWR